MLSIIHSARMQSRHRRGLVLFCLVVATALEPPYLSAQTTATISGIISDQRGGGIPNAQITITNLDTGQVRTLLSDDLGRYFAPGLNPGRYKVSVAAAGFAGAVQSETTLTVGLEQPVNFSLRPGEVLQKIEVTSELPVVQTTNANLSELVNTQTVRALPLNGRSFDQLIFLQPSVSVATSAGSSPNQGRGSKFSVGGARLTSNVFMLDGTDMNDSQNFTPGGAGGQMLGVESILEFQVITHNAPAQYGRSMGGIINAASKSGGNTVHGDLYEFLRNSVFDARNYFDDPQQPIPPFKRNQFGASLGGPIRKDHVFYFANYEGLRESLGVSKKATVPSAGTHQLCMPPISPQVNPSVCPYLALYPSANQPDGQTLLFSQNQPTHADYGTGRIDWNFNEKNSVFARYTMDDSGKLRQDAPDHVLGLFAENETHRNQYVSLGATHLFSPRLLNIARFGFNRSTALVNLFNQANVPAALSFIPGQPFGRITIGGGLSPLGATINDPRYFFMNSFQPGDDLSISLGAHALKTGFILERFQWNTAAFNRIGGDYVFPSLTEFLHANPQSVDAPFPGSEPGRGLRAILFGTYLQDDYRFNRHLTLNLGLRYELTTVPTEVNGKMSFLLDPSDTTLKQQQPFAGNHLNFAPRLGFAWDVRGDGKTALRGGWGIYYDQILLNQFLNMFDRNPPQWLTITLNTPPVPFPNPFSGGAPPPGFSLQNAVFGDFKTPYAYQYSLTLQREIFSRLVVSAAYVGSRGKHLIERFEGNTPIPVVLSAGQACTPSRLPDATHRLLPAGTLCTPSPAPLRNPSWGALQTRRLSGLSYYNALAVSVNRHFLSGLQVQGAYTYSKSIDTSSGLFSEESDNAATGLQNPDNIFNDKALSNFDVRHSAVINFLYELPLGKNLQGFAGQVLRGWGLGGIATFATGVPFTVENSANRSQNRATGANFSDRPNLAPGASNNPTHGVSAGCAGIPAGTPVGTPRLFFDPCAFAPQPLGTFGNLGRNTLIGPGVSEVDLLIDKQFWITERKELRFRAECFNILNHPNFEAPNSSNRRIFAGGLNPPPSSSAGQLPRTTTTSRQIQFGLKFIW